MYFTRFAPILEKKHIWQHHLINAKTDRDVMLISSEAFGLLVLENQWDRWVDIYVRSGGEIVTDKTLGLKMSTLLCHPSLLVVVLCVMSMATRSSWFNVSLEQTFLRYVCL